MKKRTDGFLAPDQIGRETEIFSYIRELHEYLWEFVRAIHPGASGDLEDFVDAALEEAKRGLAAKDVLVKTATDDENVCRLVAATSSSDPMTLMGKCWVYIKEERIKNGED